MVSRMKEVAAYPVVTLYVAGLVSSILSIVVAAIFEPARYDFLEGRDLPLLTAWVFAVAGFIRSHAIAILALYLGMLVLTVWLFSPAAGALRVLLRLLDSLPGSSRMTRSMDSARLCLSLSALLRQRMPMPEALETSAQLTEGLALPAALRRIADGLRAGGSLADLLSAERAVDALVRLTFQRTPEGELPDELARLAELYDHRLALSARSAVGAWTAFLVTLYGGHEGRHAVGRGVAPDVGRHRAG